MLLIPTKLYLLEIDFLLVDSSKLTVILFGNSLTRRMVKKELKTCNSNNKLMLHGTITTNSSMKTT